MSSKLSLRRKGNRTRTKKTCRQGNSHRRQGNSHRRQGNSHRRQGKSHGGMIARIGKDVAVGLGQKVLIDSLRRKPPLPPPSIIATGAPIFKFPKLDKFDDSESIYTPIPTPSSSSYNSFTKKFLSSSSSSSSQMDRPPLKDLTNLDSSVAQATATEVPSSDRENKKPEKPMKEYHIPHATIRQMKTTKPSSSSTTKRRGLR